MAHARTNAHIDYPEIFEPMKQTFDLAMKWTWEEMEDDEISMEVFIGSHLKCLTCFMNETDLQTAKRNGQNYEKCPIELQRIMNSSSIGMSLYKHSFVRVSRTLFRGMVGRSMLDLEAQEYSEEAIDAFRLSMATQARNMFNRGHAGCEKCDHDAVTFLNTKMTIPLECVNDEWEKPHIARMITIAVNSGQLEPMMPWESYLMAVGDLQGVPKILLPESVLAPIRNGRMGMLDVLRPSDITLTDMATRLNGKARSLTANVYRHLDIDLCFLNQMAKPLLLQKLQTEILSFFPTEKEAVSITKVSRVCCFVPCMLQRLFCVFC